MMKQFLTAFLGSMAALWVTIILSSLLSIIMMVVMIIGLESSTPIIDIKDKSILHIDLDGTITERSQPIQLIEQIYRENETNIPLNQLLKAINNASTDKRIEGIFLDCNGLNSGLASATAIVDALNKFKESGKWIIAYGDNYEQTDYYLACTADSLLLNPVGLIDIHGVGATTMFYKGLLDKLGIEMQIVKVGTFKSAVEPFMLTGMSEANRLQQEVYLNNIWGYMSDKIATMRGVHKDIVNQWADSLIATQDPQKFISKNIIDGLCYRHEIDSLLSEFTTIEADELRLISPMDYCAAIEEDEANDSDNNIAVLYAEGDIVDSGDGGIVGNEMAPLIIELANDEDIDALVLRVNSPGGSAFASEQIWEALQQFKSKGKKFYVSMGDYAASGGYYISCGADCIYAEPLTLTGSIGIFGMIPSMRELMKEHLGVTLETVATNPNAMMSIYEPMTPIQRNSMQAMVNRGYETFVSRCAEGREMPIDSIKTIAEGRVWDGLEALKLNLVDKLGGLDMAVADIASELGYEDYNIVEYPNTQLDWIEELFGFKSHIKSSILKDELGEIYPYVVEGEKLLNANPLQCRMQSVVLN